MRDKQEKSCYNKFVIYTGVHTKEGFLIERTEITHYLNQIRVELEQACQALISSEIPMLTEELFALFERNGNRLAYESVYFARRKFLTVFGVTAVLQKKQRGHIDERIREKLSGILEEVCKEDCWALPAHVDRNKADWQNTIDLFAAETAQTLADIADICGDELGEPMYQRVRTEVERRVLVPFFVSEAPYGGWERCAHNWNAVCAGSIGSACLHLWRDVPERLEKHLDRICQSLSFYIGGFSEDGACMEGLSYYTYGMTYFVNFAEELCEYTARKTDLLRGNWAGFGANEQDKRARIASFYAACFFSSGNTISFSDGDSREPVRMGLACALRLRFPDCSFPKGGRAAMLADDACNRYLPYKMDFLATERYLEEAQCTEEKEQKSAESELIRESGLYPDRKQRSDGSWIFLPDAAWVMANAENGTGMACKGGHNDEPHNHNDVGSFLYLAEGGMFLADLGAGEYTKDYFNENRYHIFCNRSDSHNVPLIDGQGQCAGRQYRANLFESPKPGIVRIEFSDAYPVGLMKKLTRTIQFNDRTGTLYVEDTVVATEQTKVVTENLVTRISPITDENRIILVGEKAVCTIEIEKSSMVSEIAVVQEVHRNHSGKEETIFLLRWNIRQTDDVFGCRMVIKQDTGGC